MRVPAGATQIIFLRFFLIFEFGGIKRTINDWPHGKQRIYKEFLQKFLFPLDLNAPVGTEGLEETKVTVNSLQPVIKCLLKLIATLQCSLYKYV